MKINLYFLFKLFLCGILSSSVFAWADDGPSLVLSLALGEKVAFKQMLADKVSSETHAVSIQGQDALPVGIHFEVTLADAKSRPVKEMKISLSVAYDAPSFRDLPLVIQLTDLSNEAPVIALPVVITVRPELKIFVAETANGDAAWSSPETLSLLKHPQGLLLRIINQSMAPLEQAFRIHIQGHDSVKHSEGSEILANFGDEYSYWIPESQQKQIQYRLHYREKSAQMRRIEFGNLVESSLMDGANHDH